MANGATPVATAIAARSSDNGVILNFAEPLDPASVVPEKLAVRAWNYKRSSAYGSGRYTLDGASGTSTAPAASDKGNVAGDDGGDRRPGLIERITRLEKPLAGE